MTYQGESDVDMEMKTERNQVHLKIKKAGTDIKERVSNLSRQGILFGGAVIYVSLPLDKIESVHVANSLEELGFFYAGIIPYENDDVDSLKLQYIVNPSLKQDNIVTINEWGEELKNYIFKQKSKAEVIINKTI